MRLAYPHGERLRQTLPRRPRRQIRRPTRQSGQLDLQRTRGPSYKDKQLYDQLVYLESLFDATRIREKVTGGGAAVTASGKAWQDEVVAVLDVNRRELEALHRTVERYLAKNGRRFVKLGSLFRFMKV